MEYIIFTYNNIIDIPIYIYIYIYPYIYIYIYSVTKMIPAIGNSVRWNTTPIESWNMEDVLQWLDYLKLASYKPAFQTLSVSGKILSELEEGDLEKEIKVSKEDISRIMSEKKKLKGISKISHKLATRTLTASDKGRLCKLSKMVYILSPIFGVREVFEREEAKLRATHSKTSFGSYIESARGAIINGTSYFCSSCQYETQIMPMGYPGRCPNICPLFEK